ncbi:lipoprotein [Streptomyces sp. NPDC059861]|uniref:lipoprotein n=1 Tax=Streptomyces sp. NPDC059861 TaxID=3346974 RepID=UPI003658B12C
MRVGAGNTWRGLVHVALVAGLLTGCGAAEDDSEASASASTAGNAGQADQADSAGESVESGGTIGAAGSPCELPVTFDIAAKWTAESTSVPGEDVPEDLADMMWRQGPVTAACEVDAKPAGHIGFLRVWRGEPGAADARAVLEGFVGADTGGSEAKYRPFEAGDLAGTEVEYRYTSELLDETKTERALAVVTPDGPVVLHLGGLDTAEHEAMLPAYELAKRTLRAS